MRSTRGMWAIATAVALAACSDNADVTLHVGPDPATFVAAQDGDGPWRTISGSGTYTFSATGSYGIAVVCANQDYPVVTLLHATAAETTTPSVDCHIFGEPSATLAGTIAGTSGELTSVSAGFYGEGTSGADALPYSLETMPGTWDVFVQRGQPYQYDLMIREDAVTLTAGTTTTLDLDFAADGFALEPHAITFDGLGTADRIIVNAELRNNARGTFLDLSQDLSAYRALPAGKLHGEDINVVTATATQSAGVTRQVRRWFASSQDFTATLPQLPLTPLVEAEAMAPYLRMRAAIPGDIAMDRYDIVYTQSFGPGAQVVWTASLSSGYREATAADSYTLPDMSSLAGFDLSWALTPGYEVTYDTAMISSTADIGSLFRADQTAAELDGRVDTISERSGQFVP